MRVLLKHWLPLLLIYSSSQGILSTVTLCCCKKRLLIQQTRSSNLLTQTLIEITNLVEIMDAIFQARIDEIQIVEIPIYTRTSGASRVHIVETMELN